MLIKVITKNLDNEVVEKRLIHDESIRKKIVKVADLLMENNQQYEMIQSYIYFHEYKTFFLKSLNLSFCSRHE